MSPNLESGRCESLAGSSPVPSSTKTGDTIRIAGLPTAEDVCEKGTFNFSALRPLKSLRSSLERPKDIHLRDVDNSMKSQKAQLEAEIV